MRSEKKERDIIVERKDSKVLASTQAMELSLVFNSSAEEKKQGWCKRFLGRGKYVEARALIPEAGKDPDFFCSEDLSTLLMCFLILKHAKNKIGKYTFETTRYQMMKLLGDDTGGKVYARLKDSLDRLQANNITTNFWWSTVLGQRVTETKFHFLESVTKGEKDTLQVTLGQKIVESLEQGYFKLLEESGLKKIIKLRGHAKVLALYIIQLIGRKEEQFLDLNTVLRYLGLEEKYNKLPGHRFTYYVRKMVVPAMGKACETIGYICSYDKEEKQFHIERKTQQMELPLPDLLENRLPDQTDPALQQRRNTLFKQLVNMGVDDNGIDKIFQDVKEGKFDLDRIERQLKWFPFRKKDTNPAGLFIRAVYQNWPVPAVFEKEREKNLRAGIREKI